MASLAQQLEAFKAEWLKAAPAGRAELYDAKVEELRRSGIEDGALKAGQKAPLFWLTDATGTGVALAELLHHGPVVATFYRGGWCPYCNIQLRAYQAILPDLERYGARLIAISPEMPDHSLSTAEKGALKFSVLSDPGNAVAKAFGLAYRLPDELQAALSSIGKGLPSMNGDDSWELPVPATYVIGADGIITLAHVDVDYRRRLEPEALVDAVARLTKCGA
ncbi:MAG TPA: peroxiredoxin-like family protein [Hyphomicrobiaceae bacterium]|nr:peroxiredoxin-like family protein [Hyphomicrobiaceae bacterium]